MFGDRLRGDQILGGDAGTTSGTYTAAAGRHITRVMWFAGASDGTCAITSYGKSAFTITVPANSGWGGFSFLPGELPPGSVVAFTGTLSNAAIYSPAPPG